MSAAGRMQPRVLIGGAVVLLVVLIGWHWVAAHLGRAAKSETLDEFVADEAGRGPQSGKHLVAFGPIAGETHEDADRAQAGRQAHFGDQQGRRQARVLQLARHHRAQLVPNLFRHPFMPMSRYRHSRLTALQN